MNIDKPCTGCGTCCLSVKCQCSEIAFGASDEICPALCLDETKDIYRCKLVLFEIEQGIEPLIQEALGIGKGCTCETVRALYADHR